MSSPEHKKHVWNLINKIKVGMLVTDDDAENVLRGRPMHLVQDAYDGTLFFYTSKSDSKAFEVKENKDVCITFSDVSNQVYVSLSGKVKLNTDQKMIEKYWSPMVNVWFEGGKDDSDVALLEIKINKGEHWDTKESKLVQLFELAKANITDTTPDLGENEKFG